MFVGCPPAAMATKFFSPLMLLPQVWAAERECHLPHVPEPRAH